MTITLIAFFLTVVLGPNNVPTSIVRTAQQQQGYATVADCEADAATKQVAKMPGIVFWMCMGTGSGADQWMIQNWQRAPTTELPIIQAAVVAPPPTFFMTLTLSYPVPVGLRMGGFATLDACNAVRQQLNVVPTDPVQFTLSACQSTSTAVSPPVVTASVQDMLVWTTCPPRMVAGYLRVSSCLSYCDPDYHDTTPMVVTGGCPTLVATAP